MMQRPSKRQRIDFYSVDTDEVDELDCDPDELNQRRDPTYQLDQARGRASNKLRSRFEDIFIKYGRDYTGIGDEIDLRTGEVVVNNGHLQSITNVKEFGDIEGDGNSSEEEPFVHGRGSRDRTGSPDAAVRTSPRLTAISTSDRPLPSAIMGKSPRFASKALPHYISLVTPPQSSEPWDYGRTQAADPAWQVPELPRSAFVGQRYGAQAQQYIFGTGQTTIRMAGTSLLDLKDQVGDDEDVLLGTSSDNLRGQESPLIKDKFPTIGSSPSHDSGLHEMIEDVINNIPDTSPLTDKHGRVAAGTTPLGNIMTMPVQPHAEQGRKREFQDQKIVLGRDHPNPSTQWGGESPGKNTGRVQNSVERSPTMGRSKTRRRKAETHTKGQAVGIRMDSDASGVDEDSFVDLTGTTPTKPAGQILYVEIQTRKLRQSERFAPKSNRDYSQLETGESGSAGDDNSDLSLQPSSCTPVDPQQKASHSHRGDCAAGKASSPVDPGALSSSYDGPFERNTVDPAFMFSDDELLPPRKERQQKHRLGPAGRVPQESRSTVPQHDAKDRFESSVVVDECPALSGEENLMSREKSTNGRNSEPGSHASLPAQAAPLVGNKPETGALHQAEVDHNAPDQNGLSQPLRDSKDPGVICNTATATDTVEVYSPERAEVSEQTHYSVPLVLPTLASDPSSRIKEAEVPASEQPRQKVAEKKGACTSKRRRDRQSRSGLRCPPEIGHTCALTAASVPVNAEVEKASTDPPNTEVPAPATAPPPPPPSTPQPKSRPRPEDILSAKSGLISLISDDEDEEDEISFNLTDFTPSGHHRILALRPHQHQPATASTIKKGSSGSQLSSSASTTKITKHRTPDSNRKRREERRRSKNSLARGVVRVGRKDSRASSPTDSVILTPRGTKKRCGEGEFRCGRDFCFFCISI